MTGILDGRIALVTGASRGLGAAVALRFAAAGAHVILTARTVGGLEETDDAIKAAGGSATLAPLDLFEPDNLDLMAASIHQRFGRLDILASCAAQLGVLSPAHHVDPKTWERTIALNLTANQRLIRAFDPLLRLSDAGRAIFTGCGDMAAPKPFWAAYAASKAGLAALIQCYAAEVAKTAIKVSLIDPGPFQSKLREEAYPGQPPDRMPTPLDDAVTNPFIDAAG